MSNSYLSLSRNTANCICRISLILLSLILPGVTLYASPRPYLFLWFYVLLAISLAVPAWFRLFHSPLYLMIPLVCLISLYLFSWLYAFKINVAHVRCGFSKVVLLLAFYFFAVTSSIFGVLYSEVWLGYKIYIIPSESMMPSLFPGDFVVVDVWAFRKKAPSTDQIIVFKHVIESGELTFIKRVTHVAGDFFGNKKVSEGKLIVMGDHRNASRDSRSFGPIAVSSVQGKAIWIAFSVSSHGVTRYSRIATIL